MKKKNQKNLISHVVTISRWTFSENYCLLDLGVLIEHFLKLGNILFVSSLLGKHAAFVSG